MDPDFRQLKFARKFLSAKVSKTDKGAFEDKKIEEELEFSNHQDAAD